MTPRSRIYVPIEQRWLLQQSELLVSAADGHRLRDRTAPHHRPERSTTSSRPATPSCAAGTVTALRPGRERSGEAPQDVPVQCGTSRPAIWRSSSAGSIRSPRRRWSPATRSVALYVQSSPAAGRPGPGPERKGRPPSSRSTHRSSATRRTPASRSRRSRAIARRAQPAVFRAAQPGRRRARRSLAERSGELRELPDVLPRPRTGAPVVGPRGRLEELPRAVDQRGFRAVFRRALCREGSRCERDGEHPSADATHRDRRSQTRARSTSDTAWATSGRTSACSARSSTTRRRWSCTCCDGSSATRRSSPACGRSTATGSSRRPGPTISARRWSRRAGAT